MTTGAGGRVPTRIVELAALNPSCSTVTVQVPGVTASKRKTPLPSARVVNGWPPAGARLTFADATPALLGSRITPFTVTRVAGTWASSALRIDMKTTDEM